MKKNNQIGDWRSILKGSEIGIPYGLDQGKGVVVLVVPYSDEPEWQTDRALCSLLRRFQYFSFEEFSDKLLTSPDHWVTKIVQHLSQKIRINDSISGGDDRYTYILDLIAGLKEKHLYALSDEVLHDVRDLVLDIVEKYHEESVPAFGGRSLGPEDSGLIASRQIEALVIENQSMVIQTLVRRLKSLGHKYTIVGNQDEAVSILAQYSFDYILLDLNIPVDNSDISLDPDAGFNLLGRIRQVYDSRHLPVIVLSSGNSSISSAVEAMKKGANDFVEDVFASSKLETKIQSILELKQSKEVLCPRKFPASELPNEATPQKYKIVVKDCSVELDGLYITGDRTGKTRQVFDILYKQFLDDLSIGRPAHEFKGITGRVLADKIAWDEISVRKAIARLREKIQKRIKEKWGIEIGSNDIIQNLRKWEGYRINPDTVMLSSE